MFEPEPGPLVLDELPLGPRIARDNLFGSFAAGYVFDRQNAGLVLDQASIDVVGDGAPNLDGAFSATVSPAEAAHANQRTNEQPSPAATLAAAGDGTEVYRSQVSHFLPGPDGDIHMDFSRPPDPYTYQTWLQQQRGASPIGAPVPPNGGPVIVPVEGE